MGREKRIAESRARAVLEKTGTRPAAGAPRAEKTPSVSAGPGTIPTERHTGTVRALAEIVALYLVPALIIVVIGKLIFHL
jgi:hypothetical protein